MVFYAPFIEGQDKGANAFMRGCFERVVFDFGEAFVASRDIGEDEQTRHGLGGFHVGVEQRPPCGGPQLYGLFEPFDPEFPQNVAIAIVDGEERCITLRHLEKFFATSL